MSTEDDVKRVEAVMDALNGKEEKPKLIRKVRVTLDDAQVRRACFNFAMEQVNTQGGNNCMSWGGVRIAKNKTTGESEWSWEGTIYVVDGEKPKGFSAKDEWGI